MRKDIRVRVIDLINEFRGELVDVDYKDFIRYLKDHEEFNVRAHVIENRYMFGSIVKESLET